MALSVVTCWYGETADLVGDYLRAVGGADQIVTVDNATPLCHDDCVALVA
jgi:hypothetical protein